MSKNNTAVESVPDLCALINNEVKRDLLNVNDFVYGACTKLNSEPDEVLDELMTEFCYLYNRSDLPQSIDFDAIHVDCDNEAMVLVSVAEAKRTY